jgi:hypothetical protein
MRRLTLALSLFVLTAAPASAPARHGNFWQRAGVGHGPGFHAPPTEPQARPIPARGGMRFPWTGGPGARRPAFVP